GGTYYTGDISIPGAGTLAAPIVIRAAPGETPVLDGADPQTFTWTAEGGGRYSTIVNADGPHLVMAAGQRLYPYQSIADLDNMIWALPGFFANGTSVHVHLTGGANPNQTPMIVSRFGQAFFVDQDFVYFVGLTFTHYGQGSFAKALYFRAASDG